MDSQELESAQRLLPELGDPNALAGAAKVNCSNLEVLDTDFQLNEAEQLQAGLSEIFMLVDCSD